mmetsp:Transcript_37612/g.101996  ORF Transcript_37612/g.101996 Transcript_37612/m.101996 type:complete len:228 (-) Transcript_37612:1119-1802(-)
MKPVRSWLRSVAIASQRRACRSRRCEAATPPPPSPPSAPPSAAASSSASSSAEAPAFTVSVPKSWVAIVTLTVLDRARFRSCTACILGTSLASMSSTSPLGAISTNRPSAAERHRFMAFSRSLVSIGSEPNDPWNLASSSPPSPAPPPPPMSKEALVTGSSATSGSAANNSSTWPMSDADSKGNCSFTMADSHASSASASAATARTSIALSEAVPAHAAGPPSSLAA